MTAMNPIDVLRKKQTERRTSSREARLAYLKLVKRMADDDKLKAAEVSELAEVVERLEYTPERVESDVATIREAREVVESARRLQADYEASDGQRKALQTYCGVAAITQRNIDARRELAAKHAELGKLQALAEKSRIARQRVEAMKAEQPELLHEVGL